MRFKIGVSVLIGCLVLVFAAVGPAAAEERTLEYASILDRLEMRAVGPAIMGGRTVDFAVSPGNVSTIYAAVGPSGVWKSINAGVTWEPVFHRETTVAAGAVAVSPSHSDIVWVGTGEGTSRNSVGIGDGVYKSEDGGKTWRNMGLADTRHISQILINAVNPDTVYVAALGHLWGANPDRGVFRTRDGGKTWDKVLFIDEDTGIADLAIDPSNDRILYAAAWDYRRKPYSFRSGGPGSAVYKTSDGGDTWRKIHKGLPGGPFGRIGLDVCRSRPEVVYALVEGRDSGVFRSEDKGETWKRMGDKRTYDRINFRPFYYSKITVDPNNDLKVYVYSGSSYVSRDGGKTFTMISGETHPDHHMMWVDPNDSRHLLDGNDGGIDISWDAGATWRSVRSAAWAEVYQVGFDMREPYRAYVGLQDNGSWGAPVNSLDPAGILDFHWYVIGGGDGFYIQVDPRDWSTVYRNAHMGGITRFDVRTGDSQTIKPVAPLDSPPYRFNWNSPIQISPHDPGVIYFGGNYLFKSTDRGRSWEIISPDLSTDDPEKQRDSGGITADNTGAEIHCTVYTISESPLRAGVIWVGTDDGLVQLTTDGGENWIDLTPNIKSLPSDSWVTRVEASRIDAGTAYATFDRHRMDDYRPWLFKTRDFGKTWTPLHGDLPETGYLHVVREDPFNPDLLFAGSEFGLFFSFDGGREWVPYRNGFPTVAVRDIQIHPREHDLLVGTHGRGLWVLDDIRPIEACAAEGLDAPAVLFDIRPATLYSRKSQSMYSGPHAFAGPNPPFGALISYHLGRPPESGEDFSLTVEDGDGRTVSRLAASRKSGMHRVVWNLREGTTPPDRGERSRYRRFSGGPYVLPGEYRVVLARGGLKLEKPLSVRADPRHNFSREERLANQSFAREIGELTAKGTRLISRMESLAEQLAEVKNHLSEPAGDTGSAHARLKSLENTVARIREAYSTSVEGATGYRRPVRIALRGGTLPEQISRLRGNVVGYQGAPTRTQIEQFNDIKRSVEPLLAEAGQIEKVLIPELNRLLNQAGFPVLK